MVELEEALEIFKTEMFNKFVERANKHRERSVVVAGNKYLNEPGVYEGLWDHFESEIDEIREAKSTQEEIEEAVDVANMAFLIWWRDRGLDT